MTSTTTTTPDTTATAEAEGTTLAPRTLGVASTIRATALATAEAAIATREGTVKDLRVTFGVRLAYAVANGTIVPPEGTRLGEYIAAEYPHATESKGKADNLLATGKALIVLGDEATLPIGHAMYSCKGYGVSTTDLLAQAEASKGKPEARIVAAFELMARDADDKRKARAQAARDKRAAESDADESEGGTTVKAKASTLDRLTACGVVLAAVKADTLTGAEGAALAVVLAHAERIMHEAGLTADALAALVA
jgi:hypothetical protein